LSRFTSRFGSAYFFDFPRFPAGFVFEGFFVTTLFTLAFSVDFALGLAAAGSFSSTSKPPCQNFAERMSRAMCPRMALASWYHSMLHSLYL
jgi:hypothetical protein